MGRDLEIWQASHAAEEVNEYEVGHRFEVRGSTAVFDFIYPRTDDRVRRLRVGLEDVRAANDIRIRFDFDRDGWVIESATKFSWADGGGHGRRAPRGGRVHPGVQRGRARCARARLTGVTVTVTVNACQMVSTFETRGPVSLVKCGAPGETRTHDL